jgi:Asp-tRNA(Asn)/Glu-tRNA(Gln) amidotransferase A subunit family amidase
MNRSPSSPDPIPGPAGGPARAAWRLPTLEQTRTAVAGGETRSVDLVAAALERQAALEPWLRAFAWIDSQRALRLAAAADAAADAARAAGTAGALGALHGVPVGMKDIVDTAGVPTEHGSALFAGRVPDASATVVRHLEAAGAVILGKTVTTEVAYFQPGKTTNPWNRRHTPGGSSMGSAAAVAAGIVPVALGTQTNGSIVRPAAFCGVVGFKPTSGRLSLAGILAHSQTLDQPGGFARSVADAAWFAAALAGEPVASWWDAGAGWRTGDGPRLAVARTADWPAATPAQRARFEADVAALAAAGARIEEPALPEGLEASPPVQRTLQAYELHRNLGAAVAAAPQRASEALRRFLAEGAAIPDAAYAAARAERERLIARYAAWVGPYDAVLTPPATGEAPGPETTGDPRFCTRWTLLGVPAIVLPTGLGPAGLPLGLQLAGAAGEDRRLLAVAAWAERALPEIGGPPI